MAPTISLHMIVKNEARSIERVLGTVAQYIDTWDIVDTGSTDGTPKLIEKALAGVPGRLHREPFIPFEDTGIIDFGATRTRSLHLAEEHADFTFWLSGDEYLFGGEKIREFCDAHQGDDPRIYSTTARYDGLHTDRPFLFRKGTGAQWVDPIHEWIHGGTGGGRLPSDVFVLHTGAAYVPRAERYARDLVIFERLVARDPKNTRWAYYLAQTLECLGRHREAADAYSRRVAMGGWEEERFSAAWIGARELASSGAPWHEALIRYMEAHIMRPQRAEPLFEIAKHYASLDQHGPAYTFANAAAALPVPAGDTHFVQHDIYTYRALDLVAVHAWYAGARAEGRAAAEKLAAMFPQDERRAVNLGHYTGRKRVKIGDAKITLRTDRFGDEQIFKEVVEQDEYRLAGMDLPENATVIDAGCHIGIFSAAVHARFPDAHILGIEMDAENFACAIKHLGPINKHAHVMNRMLIGTKEPVGYVPSANNSGGNTVCFRGEASAGDARSIEAASLQNMVDMITSGSIDLLKMDIESAEHDVLALAASDGTLDRIDRIAMEWHAWRAGETAESLAALFESKGFVVEVVRSDVPTQGLIFAKRPEAMERDRRATAAMSLAKL